MDPASFHCWHRSADGALPGPEFMECDEAFVDVGDHHHRQPRLNQGRALYCCAKDEEQREHHDPVCAADRLPNHGISGDPPADEALADHEGAENDWNAHDP